MLITYHGHSEFILESSDGFILALDPFDAHVGYPMHEYFADVVSVSHQHSDHNYTEKIKGLPQIISKAGKTQVREDISITQIDAFHDDDEGALRGHTFLTLIEMDGLRLLHAGDLGTKLTGEQVAEIGQVDVLFIPVGGYYTIDAPQALETVRALSPTLTLPMHYKTACNASWPIASLGDFVRVLSSNDVVEMPLLRITKEDISCAPPFIALIPYGSSNQMEEIE